MKITPEDMQKLYKHDFCSFTQFAFNELNPHIKYTHNWHINVIAEALAKVESGAIKRLIINLPPRMLKSHCASISFPAWVLGRDPTKNILCITGSNDLGSDLEDNFYRLVKSNRYRALFSQIAYSQSSRRISTQFGGFRKSACMETSLTGVGADVVIIDDPISTSKAMDESERKNVNLTFDQNIYQRLNDKHDGAIIIVMQRLHENDLCGHILQKSSDWHHINLPAFAVEDEEWILSSGKMIKRKKWDALHPERESYQELVNLRYKIGAHAFAYQFLQGQMKPAFGAIHVPKKYYSHDEWYEKAPEEVFEAKFMFDHGVAIVPTGCDSIEEWKEKYEEKAKGTYRSQLGRCLKEGEAELGT